MTTPTTSWLGALALSITCIGCGGAATTGDDSTHRELLEDVPELRAAFETGGGQPAPAGRSASVPGSVPPGFTGTQQFAGRFGGAISASSKSPGCAGHVTEQPNHQLYIGGELPFAQLVVNANPHDTTLLLELPDGSFVCNDDTHGLNPAIALAPMPEGTLRVWVGAYSSGTEGEYRMVLTTDRSVTADDVGSPVGP